MRGKRLYPLRRVVALLVINSTSVCEGEAMPFGIDSTLSESKSSNPSISSQVSLLESKPESCRLA